MIRIVTLAAVLAALAVSPASACWTHVPLDHLALDSDAIVVGRLVKIERTRGFLGRRGFDYRGTIVVERALWPRGRKPRSVEIAWRASGLSTDPDHGRLAGRRVLWLLERPFPLHLGPYRADYPGRTIPLENASSVRFALDGLAKDLRSVSLIERVAAVLDEALAELERGMKPGS